MILISEFIHPDGLRTLKKAGLKVNYVVDVEPLPFEHPLRDAPNVWITPHIAGLTREAQERVTVRVVNGVMEALQRTAHESAG